MYQNYCERTMQRTQAFCSQPQKTNVYSNKNYNQNVKNSDYNSDTNQPCSEVNHKEQNMLVNCQYIGRIDERLQENEKGRVGLVDHKNVDYFQSNMEEFKNPRTCGRKSPNRSSEGDDSKNASVEIFNKPLYTKWHEGLFSVMKGHERPRDEHEPTRPVQNLFASSKTCSSFQQACSNLFACPTVLFTCSTDLLPKFVHLFNRLVQNMFTCSRDFSRIDTGYVSAESSMRKRGREGSHAHIGASPYWMLDKWTKKMPGLGLQGVQEKNRGNR
ncbi:hypothetical protein NQ317_009009 [Molorchus minor]|uniref:Uncharacterized protein n=1 Tax=Molorchus minor TaxID=1323400 RepID=A0ABQ9JKZ3_9CUCU|nr:hypothetical protein NQ317_009009 [Molorchus minor]